jgi:hypothetical protein
LPWRYEYETDLEQRRRVAGVGLRCVPDPPEETVAAVAALDHGHDVIDRVQEPQSGAIVAVGEAGQGDGNGRIADLTQPPGDRLPGPASLPGDEDEDEGG